MFQKVLICSDVSDASNILVGCGQELKGIGVHEVILGHAINAAGVEVRFNEDAHRDTLPTDILDMLEKQKAILEQGGLSVSIQVGEGSPAKVLNEMAEKNNVSAIIVGSHGKDIVKRATWGSVSSELITTARKPVFLVKVKVDEADKVILACRKLFNHILYLTDFSRTAEKALDYLEVIIRQTGCPVTLLHVQERDKLEELAESAPELHSEIFKDITAKRAHTVKFSLEAIKSRLESAGSTLVKLSSPKGRPVDLVMDTIRNNNELSLVVMGSQGKGFVKELFFGSLSLQVSRYSPIPVLLVPAKI
ncbi:universal stress protein [Desulfitibacter alkalitolerans]|uniref:universal stress protein n=1 Tax=Desulfitibacter alkalitolerans TaxID=264641 RepID=UPI000485BF86|nr:universal stress protein [Desulfitibacter alkalitolerans]